MTISFRTTETIKKEPLENFVHYDKLQTTKKGENLLTLYINTRNKHNFRIDELKFLLDNDYQLQPELVKDKLVFIYENVFNHENFDFFKNKFFPQANQCNSYFALTLPVASKFEIFYQHYKDNDIFVSNKFNLFNDIFGHTALDFSALSQAMDFHKKLNKCLVFLVENKKIIAEDLNLLTDPHCVEMYKHNFYNSYQELLKVENLINTFGFGDKPEPLVLVDALDDLKAIQSGLLKILLDKGLNCRGTSPKSQKI